MRRAGPFDWARRDLPVDQVSLQPPFESFTRHVGQILAVGKRLAKDADQGKRTYPQILGIDASRQRAAELVDEACDALTLLGPAAAPLESLARFVLDRNH